MPKEVKTEQKIKRWKEKRRLTNFNGGDCFQNRFFSFPLLFFIVYGCWKEKIDKLQWVAKHLVLVLKNLFMD